MTIIRKIRAFTLKTEVVMGRPCVFDMSRAPEFSFRLVKLTVNFEYAGFCVISVNELGDDFDPYAIRNLELDGNRMMGDPIRVHGEYSGYIPSGYPFEFEADLCFTFLGESTK